MNPQFRQFLTTYLDLEQAYVVTGSLRTTLHAFNASFGQAVRDGLTSVLESRELSVDDYEGITGIEFEDEESLYTYLREMHDYLFGDRADQPVPPEQ